MDYAPCGRPTPLLLYLLTYVLISMKRQKLYPAKRCQYRIGYRIFGKLDKHLNEKDSAFKCFEYFALGGRINTPAAGNLTLIVRMNLKAR